MKVRPIPTFFLVIFILSLVLGLFYTFSYYVARSPVVELRMSDVSRSRDIFTSFSTINTSYTAGEKVVSYLEILNLSNKTINRINFTLRVIALSLFGFQILEMNDYSTRSYRNGTMETIVIERDLPVVTPSGFFALQLSVKPEGFDPLEPCELVIYVSRSKYLMHFLVSSIVFSGSCYGLLQISAYIRRVNIESVRPTFRKAALLLVSTNLLVERVKNKRIGFPSRFSIGQRFVFSAICILLFMAMSLILRMQGLAEQLAIIVYFCLTIGVANLLWENFKRAKPTKLKMTFQLRSLVSLSLLTLLVYFSVSVISIVFLAALAVITVVVAVNSILRVRKGEH